MNSRAARALAAVALMVTSAGCSQEPPAPVPAPEPSAPTTVPEYDARAEAAAAVLPLVPTTATSLAVTDLGRVRQQLGLAEVGGDRTAPERAAFWERAGREAALLTDGLLRPVDARLASTYGFTQDDVQWEARFDGPDGPGWVLSFRLGIDMSAVQRAVRDGVGVLAGAEVRPEDSLVVSGAAADGAESWAADPAVAALVGTPAEATYAERGCVDPPAGVDTARLDELDAWSVALHGGLATARLGVDRGDAFTRLRLSETWPTATPAFSDGFRDGVADPGTGRLGYRVVDPRVAATLVRERTLPFAACAS